MRIPLRIFRDSAVVPDWGFQARRHISGRQETVEWAFIPRTAAGEVSHYGRLSGLAADCFDQMDDASTQLRHFDLSEGLDQR